jgi:erythromycin esterase
MLSRRLFTRTALGVAAVAVTDALLPRTAAAHAGGPPDAAGVTRWARHQAVPISAGSGRWAADLAAIGRAARGTWIVGLGETSHRLREVTSLKSRYLKHLVEHEGFRAIAWEEDWTLCTRINDYLLGRRDDLDTILRTLDPTWRTHEVRDTLTWLRRFNDTHGDRVRLAGAEYFATGPLAYEAVKAYVAEHRPERLAELAAYYELLQPESENMQDHLMAYMAIPDKTPYLTAAAGQRDLVGAIAPRRHDSGYETVAHHARQIFSFYEGFSRPWEQIPAYRDARAAENIRWWQRFTGERVVYWAAGAHVADAPGLTVTQPGQPDTVFASAGSYLADWYGRAYVRVGFTYDCGTYLAEGQTVHLPAAAPGWFEEPLGDVPYPQFLLALGGPAPNAVREWLDRPFQTRGLPEFGYGSTMRGGTLREWYDIVVHRQEVTPAQPL